MKNKFVKYGVGSGLMLAGASVFAAIPAEVTDELASVKADAVSLAFAFLIIVVAVAGVKILRRAIGS